ncbi:putative spermidine/putrescine transport system permease protein [Microvirga flocculans]|uniref:Putative spermidine/putrescine transport system permease protein n=1 Tax=Microvirga flocculans TaxID=217168 RepID=A0A7W6IBP6_9HYPH|nr:ABC transporter permease [Microvirga flocculans]MBB4038439.1 putative spermidine/putrescine transport system permease protein [Microvirga flocculans]
MRDAPTLSAAVEAAALGKGGKSRHNVASLAVPATLTVAGILFLPLLMLFRISFNQYDRYDLMIETFTLSNYTEILTDSFYRSVLLRTFEVAVLSTAVTLALAFPVAYFVARAPARWKSLLIILTIFPLFVGNMVRAAGWMAIMGNQGFLNQILLKMGLIGTPIEILYTPSAVFVGIVAVVLPFMILSLQSVIEGIDPNLELAASNLGAGPLMTFRHVILPLALPGVLAGTVLVFILCMNAYAMPVLLGGPRFHVMAPQVYQQITGQSNWPFGGALAFILMMTTLILTFVSTSVIQRQYRP